jgi:hypothetical protein
MRAFLVFFYLLFAQSNSIGGLTNANIMIDIVVDFYFIVGVCQAAN